MTMINVPIDDFDPLIGYSNYADWQTPDPSVNPTWYNASQEVTGSIWHEATYHLTTAPNTRVTLNATTSSLTIYGASNGSFTITIDPSSTQPFTQTYSGTTQGDLLQSGQRNILASFENLRWDKHEVVLENKNGALLVDMMMINSAVAAEGSSSRNETIEDTSPNVVYSGKWTTQTGPNFSNGTSTYTQGGDNTMAIAFQGSAFYLYGDSVNDHGFYEVYIDQGDKPWENGRSPNATLNDRSGCGGGWAKACEKLNGLKYFVGGLGEGNHTLALRNLGYGSYPGDPTFFDFNTAYVTIPDSYPNMAIQPGPCPFTNCTNDAAGASGVSASGSATTTSSSPSGTTSGRSATTSNAAGARMDGGTGYLAGSLGLAVLLCKAFGF